MQWGTPEQKARYHPENSFRRRNLVPGLSEPNHGSDLAAVETRAVDNGDHFVVNGSKVWTSMHITRTSRHYSVAAIPVRPNIAD